MKINIQEEIHGTEINDKLKKLTFYKIINSKKILNNYLILKK